MMILSESTECQTSTWKRISYGTLEYILYSSANIFSVFLIKNSVVNIMSTLQSPD